MKEEACRLCYQLEGVELHHQHKREGYGTVTIVTNFKKEAYFANIKQEAIVLLLLAWKGSLWHYCNQLGGGLVTIKIKEKVMLLLLTTSRRFMFP